MILITVSFSFGLTQKKQKVKTGVLVGQIDSRGLNEKNCSCTLFFMGIHESSISASLKQLFICCASSLRSGYALFDYLTLDCGL